MGGTDLAASQSNSVGSFSATNTGGGKILFDNEGSLSVGDVGNGLPVNDFRHGPSASSSRRARKPGRGRGQLLYVHRAGPTSGPHTPAARRLLRLRSGT